MKKLFILHSYILISIVANSQTNYLYFFHDDVVKLDVNTCNIRVLPKKVIQIGLKQANTKPKINYIVNVFAPNEYLFTLSNNECTTQTPKIFYIYKNISSDTLNFQLMFYQLKNKKTIDPCDKKFSPLNNRNWIIPRIGALLNSDSSYEIGFRENSDSAYLKIQVTVK